MSLPFCVGEDAQLYHNMPLNYFLGKHQHSPTLWASVVAPQATWKSEWAPARLPLIWTKTKTTLWIHGRCGHLHQKYLTKYKCALHEYNCTISGTWDQISNTKNAQIESEFSTCSRETGRRKLRGWEIINNIAYFLWKRRTIHENEPQPLNISIYLKKQGFIASMSRPLNFILCYCGCNQLISILMILFIFIYLFIFCWGG